MMRTLYLAGILAFSFNFINHDLTAQSMNPLQYMPEPSPAPNGLKRDQGVIPQTGILSPNEKLPKRDELLSPPPPPPPPPVEEKKVVPTSLTDEQLRAMQHVINQQLADIREEDYSKAYYAFSSYDFVQEFSLEKFRAFVRRNPAMYRNKSFVFDSSSFQDVVATIKGKLTSIDNQNARVQYDMIQEDGKWKIRGIDITILPPTQRPPSKSER